MPTPSEIQTCIDNLTSSSQPVNFVILAAETSQANTGISFTVATVNDLPDLETTNIGAGQIVFVESIGVPVVSTENEWKGLDGRLLRRDFLLKNIFGWGKNSIGVIGDGTQTSRCSPVRERCSATDWCQVSVGQNHTSAIKTSGELWAWGDGSVGRLGNGTAFTYVTPIREFCCAIDWCQVSAGGSHTAAIKTGGQLWTWGSGACGRLGDGTTPNKCSPVREICSATDWCQVSAGGYHTAAVKTSGELWAWGANYANSCGALGDGTTVTKCSPVREICSATDWCQVSAGGVHTAAIKTSGELWGWGSNVGGILGDGTTVTKCSPVREFCSATDWCQVSAGRNSTGAIKTSGELWAWGFNNCGALGDGTLTNRCSPVQEFCSATNWCQVSAGGYHTAAVKTSGELWAWGYNRCGALGDGNFATPLTRCSPVREICSATNWCQVSAGCFATLGILLTE